MSETTTTTTQAQAPAALPPELRFEREPCTRCGGSGHYSYCQMYGTTCFRCQGTKMTLTARGVRAREYLRALRSRKAADLKAGDKIKGVNGWITVARVEREAASRGTCTVNGVTRQLPPGLIVHGLLKGGVPYALYTDDATDFEVLFPKDVQLEQLRQAIAYQNTLTKAGSPRKR